MYLFIIGNELVFEDRLQELLVVRRSRPTLPEKPIHFHFQPNVTYGTFSPTPFPTTQSTSSSLPSLIQSIITSSPILTTVIPSKAPSIPSIPLSSIPEIVKEMKKKNVSLLNNNIKYRFLTHRISFYLSIIHRPLLTLGTTIIHSNVYLFLIYNK